MRFSWLPAVFCIGSTIVQALPAAAPVDDESFDVAEMVTQVFEARFEPHEMEDFSNIIHKRDTTETISNLLDIFNRSDILFTVLDQIAYSPSRIEKLANFTASKLGGVDLGSLKNLTTGIDLLFDINASAIYHEVLDSGVVTSLLDGILLDENFQPVLANIISRLLAGNKNLFNYLIKNVLKKLKRDEMFSKRAENGGTLETFVGNILSSVLSSKLVSEVASDALVALNDTQFLTITAKRLISNEGYQNMTAQFVIDLMGTGSVTINSKALNVTKIADKALSNPQVLVTLVGNLLSGNIQLPALGKYNKAVSAILKDVEKDGTFAELNQYVFLETHSVTKPLIPTNQIVVPRTTSSSSKRATKTSTSTRTTTTGSSSSFDLVSFDSALFSSDFFDSASTTTTRRRTTTTTLRGSDSSSAEVASILSAIRALSSTEADTTTTTKRTSTTTEDSSETANVSGILGILAGLGSSDSNQKREVPAVSTDYANGVASQQPDNFATRILILANAVILGGVMLL